MNPISHTEEICKSTFTIGGFVLFFAWSQWSFSSWKMLADKWEKHTEHKVPVKKLVLLVSKFKDIYNIYAESIIPIFQPC